MKQYNSTHTAALSTRGFYTILTVCGLIIAVSAWVLWSDSTAPEQAASAPSTPIISPKEAPPDLSDDTPVMSEEAPADEATEPVDAPAEPEPAPAEPAVTVSAPVYVRPTSGAVITPFSGDELLFQPTFGDWRVHSGTDFGAEAGETVLALTDGTVQEVFEDGLYGTLTAKRSRRARRSAHARKASTRKRRSTPTSMWRRPAPARRLTYSSCWEKAARNNRKAAGRSSRGFSVIPLPQAGPCSCLSARRPQRSRYSPQAGN